MYNKMNNEHRLSDSPTSTMDSTESTSVSVETIVDCSPTNDHQIIEKQAVALANSTNTTNNYNKNSLTNSQISMISSADPKDTSHIYNSPEHLLAESNVKPILNNSLVDEKMLPMAKKLPQKLAGQIPAKRKKSSNFPRHILFGIVQFALSIALVALGGLLLVRGASLATTGCGIWSGAIAAVAGALSVINMKSAQTGFLAVSLICVASGTLAMALAGSGLVRDMNRLDQEDTNHEAIKSAISASSGLIFALALHIVISIASVYHSAIKLCSRGTSSQMLDNAITANNASMTNDQKAEEYFNSLARSQQGKGKVMPPENADKLMALWMYTAKHAAHRHHHHHHQQQNHSPKGGMTNTLPRPIMLVPAGNGIFPHHGYRPSPAVMLPHGMMPGTMSLPYGGLAVPVLPNATHLHPEEIKALYKLRTVQKPISELGKHGHHHQTQQRRTGKNEASKRQRRRSESDVAENRKAFTYTGLDRAIADSFLKQQEQSNGSHVSCYSSAESAKDTDQEISV